MVLCALLAAPMAAGGTTVTVNGKVTDARTGSPIAGANVSVMFTVLNFIGDNGGAGATPTENLTAITAQDGTYSLSVQPGSYGLMIFADGYERSYANVEAYSSITQDIAMNKLPPFDARVTFVVTDSISGAPVGGAGVFAWPEIYMEGDAGAIGLPTYKEISGETGANGAFTTGIWNGAYTLSVNARHYYFNNSRFEVSGNDLTVSVPLIPIPPPNSTVQGRVVDQRTGRPIAGAKVLAYPMLSTDGYFGTYDELEPVITDANGSYSLKVYGGSVSISVCNDSYYGYYGTINAPDNSTMNLDVALFPIIEPERVSTLGGIVTSEKGALAGAMIEVTYTPMYSGILPWNTESGRPSMGEGSLMPAQPSTEYYSEGGAPSYYGDGTWTYNTTSGANGAFNIAVPVGALTIVVYLEGYYPYYGWQYVDAKGTYWQNATLEALPIADASINGVVNDATTGQPIANANVFAYMVMDPAQKYTELIYNMTGAGRYAGVSGGNGPAPPVSNGSAAPIDISLTPPAGIDLMAPYGYYCCQTTTGPDGQFKLSLPHGRHILDVWAPGHEYYSSEVDVAEGQAISLEISLAQGSNGVPAPGGAGNGQYVLPITGGIRDMPSPGGPESISMAPGEEYALSVGDVFNGGPASGITYGYDSPSNLQVSYDRASGKITITAPKGWTGDEVIRLKASDGTTTIYHSVQVKVANPPPVLAAAGFIGAIVLALAVLAAIWRAQRE